MRLLRARLTAPSAIVALAIVAVPVRAADDPPKAAQRASFERYSRVLQEDTRTEEAQRPTIGHFLVELNWKVGSAPIPASQEVIRTRAARELYERLVREYDEAQQAYINALRSYRSQEEFKEAQKKDPNEEEYARRLLLLARSYPEDPMAVDAINWVFTVGGIDSGPLAEKAVDLLIKDHLPHGTFGPVCRDLAFAANRNAERLFRAALEKSEDREVRGWSNFGLAQCYFFQIVYGHPADPKKTFEEAERLFQKAGEDYGDLTFPARLWANRARRTPIVMGVGDAIESGHNTLADLVQIRLMLLRARRDLVVDKPAYEIEGEDLDGRPMKLSAHRGQVVVLVFFVAGDLPFREMVPHLRDLVRRMDGKPFALLGISAGDDRDELKRFTVRERINWRTCWDNGKRVWLRGGPIFAQWDINGTPMIYVLDHHGVIRYKDIAGKRLDDAVETLLKELGAAEAGQSKSRKR